jgi:DNA-binding NarL/FixJ family response regulator
VNTNKVLRIIVADDQASVREGLVVLLDLLPDIDVVASAASGQEALDLADEYHPDAILLDLHMPVMDGTEAARLLTARHPDIAIVVLTTYADDTSILAALSAGARSYLTKDADRSTIAQALRGAASGLSVLAPSAQATLLTAAAAAATAPPTSPAGRAGELPAGLTPREAEILTMIGRGMTNAEIAQTLVLSNHTIKTHINRIFAKTGSANRTEASGFARAHGLT